MSDPIAGGTDVLRTAAQFGPEMFLSVAILLFVGVLLWLVLTMQGKRESIFVDLIANNTRAVESLAASLRVICTDLQRHDAKTNGAVDTVHAMKPAVDRIDARTETMNSKVDKLMGRDEK